MLFAKEVTLPTSTSPHLIGTVAIEIHDDPRQMMRDSSSRLWMVQAFYPTVGTPSADEKYPYMPGTLDHGMMEGTQVLAHAKLEIISIYCGLI